MFIVVIEYNSTGDTCGKCDSRTSGVINLLNTSMTNALGGCITIDDRTCFGSTSNCLDNSRSNTLKMAIVRINRFSNEIGDNGNGGTISVLIDFTITIIEVVIGTNLESNSTRNYRTPLKSNRGGSGIKSLGLINLIGCEVSINLSTGKRILNQVTNRGLTLVATIGVLKQLCYKQPISDCSLYITI